MLTAHDTPQEEASVQERMLRAEITKLRARNDMLEAENRTLMKRISELTEALAEETNKDKQLALSLELKLLQERINDRNRDLFGKTSEKRGRPGGAKRDTQKKRGRKSTGSKRTEQPNLAKEQQRHLLDEADQVCRGCGSKLYAKAGKFDSSERIVFTERVYTVMTHEMQVYGCGGCGGSETALAPVQLVPGGRYDSSVAVKVAVDKYADHQPLNRQVIAMRRTGLKVSRQSLWDQLNPLARLCEPTYQALHEWMLSHHDLLHVDETTWRMMFKGGSTKWWMWALAAHDGFFCTIAPTRSTKAARLLLRDFAGTLMSDGYSVYQKLAKEAEQNNFKLTDEQPWHPRFSHVICWSHARRPFEKAAKHDDAADVVLDDIAELYEVEARAKLLAGGDRQELFKIRARLRASESKPIIDKIQDWRAKQLALPGTRMNEGLTFLKNQWAQLTRFLDTPVAPLDNNLAERQVRTPVLGRKNHLGSHSERGAHVSALFYSLIGSCRLVGVAPDHYLNTLVERALQDPAYTLLPHEFAAELAG